MFMEINYFLQDRKKAEYSVPSHGLFISLKKLNCMASRLPLWILGFILVLFVSSCQKTISGNGVVMDKGSGLPLKGVSISAYLENPSPDTFQMHTETDSGGSYYVYSNPQVCTGSCPALYVQIVMTGYKSEYVKNPHGDTTYLVRTSQIQKGRQKSIDYIVKTPKQ